MLFVVVGVNAGLVNSNSVIQKSQLLQQVIWFQAQWYPWFVIRRFLSVMMLAWVPAIGQASGEPPLFASHDVIEVTINAPLKALVNDNDAEPGYRPATLQYDDADGNTHTLDIGIRPRGKNRRKKEVCEFPPLRLNFRSSQTAGTVFAGQDKLKLVAHCRRGSSFRQYVLQEYLVYRVLNQLTEQSFKVRLLSVTYNSTDSRKKPLNSHAFVIEDRDHMAARGGFEYRAPQSIRRHELDDEAGTLVGVFQYLIGNTDWSMLDGPGDDRCCHNMVLISRNDGAYVPVPYDFDYSGIINTPYAIPSQAVKIRSVRTRVYRGFCKPPELLAATLQRFRDKKQEIYDLYSGQPGLASATVTKTTKYLDEFYKTIDDERRRERRIVGRCR